MNIEKENSIVKAILEPEVLGKLNKPISKELLNNQTKLLSFCPFCGEKAEFVTNKSNQIILQHHPPIGIICPARYEGYCETFDFGLKSWNKCDGLGSDISAER